MLKENKPEFLDIAVNQPKSKVARRPKKIKVVDADTTPEVGQQPAISEKPVENYSYNPVADLYRVYHDYYKSQQREVLNFWIHVVNNTFWWARK